MYALFTHSCENECVNLCDQGLQFNLNVLSWVLG